MDFIRAHILVCTGTGCASAGAAGLMDAFESQLKKHGLDKEVRVVKTGCLGLCAKGPNVVVYPEGVYYNYVSAEDVPEIVEEHLLKGRLVERLIHGDAEQPGKATNLTDTAFYQDQVRIALRNCGVINPEDIDEYIAYDGYAALGKVLTEMTPQQVIDEIKASGLKGRGGAGFPTGMKWQFAANSPGPIKYACCNADEGDPGAFMDRSVLEGDPHSVLEAMTIAGYAIGATQGYIYVRAEYPIAVERLQHALKQSHEYGFLGEDIFGTGFNFDIGIRLGSGAFVCGEETALMVSIEGKRGEPRNRPPYPAVKGLFGKPTLLNNVETLSNLPECIDRRVMKHRTLTEADFLNAYVEVEFYDEAHDGWRGQEYFLTCEQAIELYRTAILPDAASGNIGRFFVYGTPDRDALMSNVNITMEITPDPDPTVAERDAGPYYYADRSWLDLNVLMSAENTRRWLEAALPLLKPDGSVYVCCDWRSSLVIGRVLSEKLTVRNRITWQREKGRGAKKNWKNALEDIWFATASEAYYFDADAVRQRRRVLAPYREDGQPKDWEQTADGRFRDTAPSNFWDDISVPYWSMPENTAHPTQKPEKLLAKLILASCPPGGVVLDPFLGSGSSAVTAKKLGRHFVGIEQNPRYCVWCEKRLELAESAPGIQGYADGVFWERNTFAQQKKFETGEQCAEK